MRKQLITVMKAVLNGLLNLSKKNTSISASALAPHNTHQALENFLILSRNKGLYMYTHVSICPDIMTSICKVIYIERNTGIWRDKGVLCG